MQPQPQASTVQIGGSHYKDFAIQPSEFIHRNRIGFLEGNAIKYLVRHKAKNGKQDLEKAMHYIDLLIQWEYPDLIQEPAALRPTLPQPAIDPGKYQPVPVPVGGSLG